MPELTVANATDEQVWPDAEFRPSPELRAEIRRVAKTVSAAEVSASGLTWASWYIKFVIAEHRVEDRHKQLAEAHKKAQENAAKTAAVKAKYPPASAWGKPVKYVKVLEGEDDRERACEAFRKEWFDASRNLPVFRPSVAAHAGMTINDGRALYRNVLVTMAESDCLSSFVVREANERITKLEKRIEELEQRKMPEYKGVWKQDQEYDDNSLVTHDGSMFIARAQSKGVRPGDGNLWTLCVKRGRDARAVVARKDSQ